MRAILLAAVALATACGSVPDLPPVTAAHPASPAGLETPGPELRGPASAVLAANAPESGAKQPALMPDSMPGGRR